MNLTKILPALGIVGVGLLVLASGEESTDTTTGGGGSGGGGTGGGGGGGSGGGGPTPKPDPSLPPPPPLLHWESPFDYSRYTVTPQKGTPPPAVLAGDPQDTNIAFALFDLEAYLIDHGVDINVVTPEMLTRMPSAPEQNGRRPVAIPHSDLWPNMVRTALMFMWLSEQMSAPIYITGAYRPPDYNKAVTCEKENAAGECVDWSKNSAHQWFSSLDISAAPGDKRELDLLGAQLYISQPRIGFGVYGTPGSIHIDTGSLLAKKRRWNFAQHYIDLVKATS